MLCSSSRMYRELSFTIQGGGRNVNQIHSCVHSHSRYTFVCYCSFLCTLTKPTVVFSAIRYEIGSLTWCATHSDVPTIMECIFLGNNKATTPNNDIGKAFYSTNPYQELGRGGQFCLFGYFKVRLWQSVALQVNLWRINVCALESMDLHYGQVKKKVIN